MRSDVAWITQIPRFHRATTVLPSVKAENRLPTPKVNAMDAKA